ncbi:unnamed protein product [Allacma fusca]|uniref:GST C-terminal domain-containing protein n=1 Tax=Allacma fusca TaxID=39272 RepID=A0A8J2K8A7_9HEXA|nr:unnamed protein product [Allacma fusca]
MATNFTGQIEEGGEFPPEANRYHLYVSLGCPFAHRVTMVRALKGLEDVIGLSIANCTLGKDGWSFATDAECPGAIPDSVNNFKFLREMYSLSDPNFAGRITVPVLFDTVKNRIVNNESGDIIKILNSSFNKFCKNPSLNLYPANLEMRIDQLNDMINTGINSGVYVAGYATTQDSYRAGVRLVHQTLSELDYILRKTPGGFLLGETLTESDVRLFPTLIRFDPIYVNVFKCNLSRVQDFPHLSAWLKRVFEVEGIRDTVNMRHIKNFYFLSDRASSWNPNRIVPLYNGPLLPSD